jgi:hypothetical protein
VPPKETRGSIRASPDRLMQGMRQNASATEGEDSEGDHSEGVEEQHVDAEQLIHWSMQSSREGSRIQMPQRTWKIGGKDSVTKSVVATESECVVRRRNSRQLDNEQDGCRSEAMTFPSLQ